MFTPFCLTSTSVHLSYLFFVVLMRKCFRRHSCTNFTFSIAILNLLLCYSPGSILFRLGSAIKLCYNNDCCIDVGVGLSKFSVLTMLCILFMQMVESLDSAVVPFHEATVPRMPVQRYQLAYIDQPREIAVYKYI